MDGYGLLAFGGQVVTMSDVRAVPSPGSMRPRKPQGTDPAPWRSACSVRCAAWSAELVLQQATLARMIRAAGPAVPGPATGSGCWASRGLRGRCGCADGQAPAPSPPRPGGMTEIIIVDRHVPYRGCRCPRSCGRRTAGRRAEPAATGEIAGANAARHGTSRLTRRRFGNPSVLRQTGTTARSA